MIVGHSDIVHGVLTCLFVGGHTLIEEVPRLGKTLLVRPLSQALDLKFTGHKLDEPFFVLATRNPSEKEGTYPLPEAQLDRFFFKLVVGYSTRDEMATILDRTTRDGSGGQGKSLLEGRNNVSFEDIKKIALPALRHRVLLNFEAQAENNSSDSVLEELLKEVKQQMADAPIPARK